MSSVLLIFAAAVCNNIALLLLKIAGKNIALAENLFLFVQKSGLFILGGALFYCISFILTIKILADNTFLSTVPSFMGINFVIAIIISLTFFKESFTLSSLIGICFICLGVWLVSSSTA